MNKFFLTLFLSAFICFFSRGQNENAAPLTKIDVTVNGKMYQIEDGDTLIIAGTQIIAKTSDLKTFEFGVVSFDYPKEFAFSFKQDFAYKNWTLDGDDFGIMYFEIGAAAEVDMLVKEMVKKFGKKNCTVRDKEVKLGELTLKGARINIELIGERLTFDIYKLQSNDFKSHFIAFQDSKNDDGSDSKQGVETMAIINRTIKQR